MVNYQLAYCGKIHIMFHILAVLKSDGTHNSIMSSLPLARKQSDISVISCLCPNLLKYGHIVAS